MSQRIAIITDSTSDLPADVIEERQIHIAPLSIQWGQDTLKDGIDITPGQFYARLQTDEHMPTTSQPSPAEFEALYHKAREATGADAVLALTISADLSGTYSSARQACDLVDFPAAAVDLRTASLATALAVLKVSDACAENATLEEATALARSLTNATELVFLLDTLEYLHKGGRIGGARRLLGTALNIKPVLHVVDGKVEARESVRTRKRALSRMMEILDDIVVSDRPLHVGILHGNAPEEAQVLREKIEARYQPERLLINQVGAVIGVHTGPGALGFATLQV